MLSIAIPAYNEENRIETTLASYNNYFKRVLGTGFELIVICDGCTDRTPEVVKEYMKKEAQIRLLFFAQRLGKGGAIMKGFEEARGDIIGFTDADEAVSPEDFYGMVKQTDDFGCIIASRRVSGATILSKQPLQRRVASRTFNIIVNFLFGLGISDTQCGAKVLRRQVYELIKGKIKSSGFEFDAELLWRVKKAGFPIKEYPISWKHTEHSKFKLRKGPGMLISLLLMRLGN